MNTKVMSHVSYVTYLPFEEAMDIPEPVKALVGYIFACGEF